jgi:hypothetical protein
MIKPTIGRVVWFHPVNADPEITHAAIVCHVWSDTVVNLHVLDSNGNFYAQTSVFLWQGDGSTPRPSSNFAEWMPYQKGQAAKTEQLERQIGSDSSDRQSDPPPPPPELPPPPPPESN